jgi:hypothetical protein
MTKSPIARKVATLVASPAVGDFRVTGKLADGKHPANGMTAQVHLGGRAFSTIINPWSFENGGIEWQLRYGNVEGVRYVAAGVIESYDYLLSEAISFKEASERLRILRAARRELSRDTSEAEQTETHTPAQTQVNP